MHRRTLLAAVAAMPLAARTHNDDPHGAVQLRRQQMPWGIASDAKAVRRTIVVRMTDAMRFTPDLIVVKLGETIRFDIRNDGRMRHEMVIGTPAVLAEHAALMIRFPGMEHDEPYMAHVAPGGRGRIVWTFNRAGEFEFACLIAGHYQAGMKGRIVVERPS